MPDAMLKKLMVLIEQTAEPDLRRAAIQVAGRLAGPKDPGLVPMLLEIARGDDPSLQLAALDALGQLKAESALPTLIEIVRQAGPELEAAARAAAHLGGRGARAMEKLMSEASAVNRRRLASALAHGGTESAAVAASHALLDEDPRVVEAAARSLAEELPTLTAAQKRALADHLLHSLQKRSKPPLSEASEAAMIRVLSAIKEPRAEAILWPRLDESRPGPVRAAAMQALGALAFARTDGKVRRLLTCAADADFQVAALATLLLRDVEPSTRSMKDWLALLEAPDVGTRRFAVGKLRRLPGVGVTRALCGCLRHPDRALREDALEALGESPSGRSELAAALLEARDAEEAWWLARAIGGQAAPLTSAARKKVFNQACKFRESEDRRSDALFFLLHKTSPEWTRSQIAAKAEARRLKKDYAAAVGFLRMLARDSECTDQNRFELAAAGLKLSSKDLAVEARSNDPVLAQFSRLLQSPTFDLYRQVSKARWLEPEDLFYLGFHFAEQNQREQAFGRKVLELLLERSPRSNLARDARRKLQSEGLTS